LLKVFFDPAFIKHDTGPNHPESAERVKAVIAAARETEGLQIVETCPAAQLEDLLLVHARSYISWLNNLKPDPLVMLDPDTPFSAYTMEAALKSVGAVIEAVKFVSTDDNNRAFCAVRPPGHHAEPDRAMGFCILNNIAIGAAYALKNGFAQKIAIVDWDVHHGNGTQAAFYNNPNVLFISLHQYHLYPGTGHVFETGANEAVGFTINLPMRPGAGDDDYRQAFDEIVMPAITNFEPELLFISAGFDAHRDDPLADINLSTQYFSEMTRQLIEKSRNHCRGRIISVFEGGYNLLALAQSVRGHLKELMSE
jgi:acetoin utilization deacetylase AcuC-like enzyme